MKQKRWRPFQFQGSTPEWYILTIKHAWDISGINKVYWTQWMKQKRWRPFQFQGSTPEWYILTIKHAWDISGINKVYWTQWMKQKRWRPFQIEGSTPEWYILTIKHAWDVPFWSRTLEIWTVLQEVLHITSMAQSSCLVARHTGTALLSFFICHLLLSLLLSLPLLYQHFLCLSFQSYVSAFSGHERATAHVDVTIKNNHFSILLFHTLPGFPLY